MIADANANTVTMLRAIADANLDGAAANAAADLVDVLAQRVGSRIRVRDDLGYAARAVADRYTERAHRAPVGAELRAAGYITLALDLQDGFDLTGLVERLERSPEREGRAACLASLRALAGEPKPKDGREVVREQQDSEAIRLWDEEIDADGK